MLQRSQRDAGANRASETESGSEDEEEEASMSAIAMDMSRSMVAHSGVSGSVAKGSSI